MLLLHVYLASSEKTDLSFPGKTGYPCPVLKKT